MRSSLDQVVDVLTGWKDDRRVVGVILTDLKWDASVKWRGVVVDVSPLRLLVFGSGIEIGLHLRKESEFDWQDPREAPPELRAESVDRYDSFLEIRDAEYRCALVAFKRLDERGLDTNASPP